MRSGATQQSGTFPAVVSIIVSGDTHTQANRLLRAYTDEQAWGGQYVIELDNSDEALNSKDYEGNSLVLNFGFQGSAGSDLAPLWVDSQQFISREGKLLLILNCIDIWGLLSRVGTSVGGEFWNYKQQMLVELAKVTLPDGSKLPAGIKADINAQYDKTIRQIIASIVSDATQTTVTLAAGDDGDTIISAQKPPIRISNARTGIRQLMEMTESYLFWKADGDLHVVKPDEHASTYTYNLMTLFYSSIHDEGVTIPNRVTYHGISSGGSHIYGTPATDASSRSKIGFYIDRHYYYTLDRLGLINTDAELTALAAGTLAKIQGERSQGLIIAPMHCAQELFDKVTVIDDRYPGGNKTTTGYVHRIIREYDRGVYRITLYLGGVTSGYTPPGDNPALPLATPETVSPVPTGIYPWQLWQAVQPYTCDIDFTAGGSSADKQHMAWASGTIYFADETSLSINANTNYAIGATPGWLYFTEGDSTLNFSTDLSVCIAPHNGIVAFIARGTETGTTCLILPYAGKVPAINADIISCIQLSAISAHVGHVTAGVIEGLTVKVTGQDLMLYYSGNLVGYLYGVTDAVALLGNPDVYIYTAASGGIAIRAGSLPSAPTVDDLWLEADEEVGMIADDDIIISALGDDVTINAQDEIRLDPESYDVVPWSTSVDLGNATKYFDDINYSDLIDRTPSARFIKDALIKMKALRTHNVEITKKGVKTGKWEEHFDRDSYPAELIRPVTDIDRAEAGKAPQHSAKRIAKWTKIKATFLKELQEGSPDDKRKIALQRTLAKVDHLIGREQAANGQEPQPGITLNATIGLLLSSVKELTEKVEQLENRLGEVV